MKYEMKHAKNSKKRTVDSIEQTEKQKKKRKITIKKKTVFITLGVIVGVSVIVLCILNFQLIYGFMSSKINILTWRSSEESSEENEEAADETENTEIEENTSIDSQEEESSEVSNNEEEEQVNGEEDGSKTAPTIELVIDEGPLYSKGDDICYYRVRAIVTGEPLPGIIFSKDDSQGSLGPDKAQVNLKRDSKSFVLTATASNAEGEATDTMTLVWSCNRSPDIKGISLSSNTLYVGEQYEVSVDVSDLDGDELSYTWSAAGGSIVDSTANPAKWNTPTTTGDYKITVAVNDGKGNTSESSTTAYVGEVTVAEEEEQQQSSSLNLPRKEAEGGYIEEKGITSNGGYIYAGDSANNNPCSGFISFDISGIGGRSVESAYLTLGGASILGDPSFYYMSNINVLDWGARPITQDDFEIDGIFVSSYDSPNITCNVSKLKEELQKAINAGKSRFQIRIHFSGPKTDSDSQNDGWKYSQSNINLNVTVSN
jgi:hypothetical protein